MLFASLSSTFVIGVIDPNHADTDPVPWGYALIVAACLPLLLRSSRPRAAALVSVPLAAVYYPLGFPDGCVMLCAIVMLYTLVRWGNRTFGWVLGLCLFLGLNGWEIGVAGGMRPEAVGVIGWVLVLLCTAEIVRRRAEFRRAEEERLTEAARSREEELLRRAADERLRLARDVHDTVAHNISLINVQAGTALYLVGDQPERAAQALETIKHTSKETLVELRTMLDVLRAGEAAPRAPVPGAADLEDLADGARGAGVDVRVEVEGPDDGALPLGVDTALHRITQEALTNVVRHSGASRAQVRVTHRPGGVRLEVVDDGRGGTAEPGNGITGMSERASLVGGTVDARPRAGGGFQVRAWLPTGAAVPPEGTEQT